MRCYHAVGVCVISALVWPGQVTGPKAAKFPPDLVATSNGSLVVCLTCTVDFDQMVVRPPLTTKIADLWLRAWTLTELSLMPVNGAQLGSVKGDDSACSACRQIAYARNGVRLEDLKVPSRICLKTNGGRVVDIKVTAPRSRDADGLLMSYTVCTK